MSARASPGTIERARTDLHSPRSVAAIDVRLQMFAGVHKRHEHSECGERNEDDHCICHRDASPLSTIGPAQPARLLKRISKSRIGVRFLRSHLFHFR